MIKPKATATSRYNVVSRGGHDGRRGFVLGTTGTLTYATANRMGVRLPNGDIRETLTLEEYRREGR